ncbi:Planctomycete cytochrome C [Arenibacter troitsensis]|uniref:Planctomycete cytochrome C n=2 Tax=Arenibacter troitsensis TaxID=188872 RepID=A0A1X7KKL7_9FLAO|nr:Planctomycete cytochrome C [Arenibacter troitsensis]
MRIDKNFAYLILVLVSLTACNNYKTEELILADNTIPDKIDYNIHVRPILSDKCFACHGPDKAKQKAGLRLDLRDAAIGELPKSPGKYAIVPGKPAKSQLFNRIITTDLSIIMPPMESHLDLSSKDKAILTRWIEQGAEYQEHWAFQSPKKYSPPKLENKEMAVNEIDHFVLKKLMENGLQFNKIADKEVLLRRLSFDLTGLPPLMEDLNQFISGQKTYEEMVDNYLQSNAYGEKMAVDWLDLARYADTHGYQSDGPRRMWPWRDWVINAYNNNMPYDQFIKWQMAGDKFPNPSQDQMIATGFNRNHLINVEGGIIAEEYRVEYVLDRTNTLGTALLGLSFECARCHDHKYDPISQKEYYETSYFFNSVDEMGQGQRDDGEVQPPSMLLTDKDIDNILLFMDMQTKEAEKKLDSVLDNSTEEYKQWANTVNLKNLVQGPVPNEIESFTFEDSKNFKSVEGIKGKAVEFDGEGGLYYPGKIDFDRYDPYSFSFWIKPPEPNGTYNFFAKSTGEYGGFRGIEMQLVDNQLEMTLAHRYPNNSIGVRTNAPLKTSEWTHVGITYDGSSKASGAQIFFNGKKQESLVLRDNLHKTIIPHTWDSKTKTYGYVFGHQDNAQGFPGGALDEFKIFDFQLSQIEIGLLAGDEDLTAQISSLSPKEREVDKKLREFYFLRKNNKTHNLRKELLEVRKAQNDTLTKIPEVMVMKDIKDSIRKTYILDRGSYDAHGEEVGPGIPKVLLAPGAAPPKTRMELAEWLVDSSNPMTSRVTVNRFWQNLFGKGIVETSNDFGSQGSLPTHPKLLDWLAIEFIESGWNVKSLIKKMVMSQTYRQSSNISKELYDKDPKNELLARGPRHRLSAEMIRDNILAASGLLVKKVGGPSVKPYQPEGLWQEKATFVGENKYVQGEGDDLYRRSIYTYWRRTIPPPFMITFDTPERNLCSVKRQSTTTPLQPLVMLNGPEYIEAAKVLVEQTMASGGEKVENQISEIFRLLTSRSPTDEEVTTLKKLYLDEKTRFENEPQHIADLLDIGAYKLDLSNKNAQVAAMTVMTNIIMNFDPVYTKY